MTKTAIAIIAAVLILAVAVLFVWTLILNARKELLDKRQVALDTRDEKLQEWDNILTAEQKTFEKRVEAIKPFLDGTAEEVSASYTVTESDEMKFSTEKAIESNANNRLAMTIAHDIIRKFHPTHDTTEDGKRRYSYKFKVVESK